jgi:sialic acid synthase SpsE
MASVFDAERLAWCEAVGVRRHKIASRVVTMYPDLCAQILATGKDTIVSLGSWTKAEKPFGERPNLRYLYCKSLYPAFLEDMGDFPADFAAEGLDGYSDHTLGIEVALLAVARGANIVEKHFTLDKTRGRATEKAHICSMTPDELSELRRTGGLMQRARTTIQATRGGQDA